MVARDVKVTLFAYVALDRLLNLLMHVPILPSYWLQPLRQTLMVVTETAVRLTIVGRAPINV